MDWLSNIIMISSYKTLMWVTVALPSAIVELFAIKASSTIYCAEVSVPKVI